MPSPSASTLQERMSNFSSCSPSRPCPFCGPSRKKVSNGDLLIPIPDPVFRGGRRVGTGAVRAAMRAAASLLDRARRCAGVRTVALPRATAVPFSASRAPEDCEDWVCAIRALEVVRT